MTSHNGELDNAMLTEFVRVHNAAIARHEQWLTEHEAAKNRHDEEMAAIRATLAATATQQQINTQEIASLRASILDLRNLVGDYLQGRSQ